MEKITFGEILRVNKGMGPGFDFVRVFLALCVLVSHVPETVLGSGNNLLSGPFIWIFQSAILPMFFGLSGFLVIGSAQRLSLKDFALNRAIRIFPALIVEILLSALIIGPIFTNISLPAYFSGSEFGTYFLNIFGFIHYRLPGLFVDNPVPYIVNGSLWTVPFEILCYIVMAGLVVSTLVKRASALVTLAVASIIFSMVLVYGVGTLPHSDRVSRYLEIYVHSGLGPLLLPCFLLGSMPFPVELDARPDTALRQSHGGTAGKNGFFGKWVSLPMRK
jgi:peptidoglycan/LPS O-acetylase OafA/YrhL